jgi:hypothetical protein
MRMYEAPAGVPVDLHLYAGQDHFFEQEPQFCDAIAGAIAFFITRYVPARVAVTTCSFEQEVQYGAAIRCLRPH